MINIEQKHKDLMLEALEELMYKLSLELSELKGGPMDKNRQRLSAKQEQIEEIQHQISAQN